MKSTAHIATTRLILTLLDTDDPTTRRPVQFTRFFAIYQKAWFLDSLF